MILLAAIGMVRMPDFYLRLSVTTKAATLGIALMLISAAIFFNETSISTRVIAIIFFLIVTAPVGAYMIGRTSYFIGIKLWSKSLFDELAGMYHEDSHELSSKMPENTTEAVSPSPPPEDNRLDT
ncbi:MAG: monovalent cation/H(+) antiporter subunit G [Chitinophagaceae bacterium]|nr:MAG: monovalent cation/H(+) antiporter subunit G [Chitinophagaceae bacterium]